LPARLRIDVATGRSVGLCRVGADGTDRPQGLIYTRSLTLACQKEGLTGGADLSSFYIGFTAEAQLITALSEGRGHGEARG
jgi:hypothetical protein